MKKGHLQKMGQYSHALGDYNPKALSIHNLEDPRGKREKITKKKIKSKQTPKRPRNKNGRELLWKQSRSLQDRNHQLGVDEIKKDWGAVKNLKKRTKAH